MLCSPFQCDRCWFINLKNKEPRSSSLTDVRLLSYIRRVNLDVLWSRESSTVEKTLNQYVKARTWADQMGIRMNMDSTIQPWAIGDSNGFGEAIIMLRYSLEKGHNASSHCQFDTIRKIRTLSTNMYESSSINGVSALSMRAGANCLNLSRCPTDSVFFRAFLRGCEKRMGGITIQDTALSVPILLNILNRYELEFAEPLSTAARKRDIVMIASYLVMGFCDGLRGNEPFLMEATALCEYAEKGRHHKDAYVCLPLMGRFKNEVGERNVMRFLVGTTASGIPIRKWIDRLVAVLRSEGKDKGGLGPAFCSQSGYVLSYRKMDWEFHKALQQVQEVHPELIAMGLEVGELYHINRSLRRGVTSRATELCLSQTIIDTNNRWKIIQTNKGKKGLYKMSQLYLDGVLVLETYLAFSRDL
jgi:hypothetical protein